MIHIKNLIKKVALAPNFIFNLSPVLTNRITAIILFYSDVLAFNAFYIQSIGSGIGVYSGLFHFTTISQQLDILISQLSLLLNSLNFIIFKYLIRYNDLYKNVISVFINKNLSLNNIKNYSTKNNQGYNGKDPNNNNINNKNNSMNSNNSNKNNKIIQFILNTISLVFLGFIFYNFIYSLNIYKFYGIIISFVISYLLTYFVFNRFKYFNKNKFAFFLQNIVLYSVILFLLGSICYYFNIN